MKQQVRFDNFNTRPVNGQAGRYHVTLLQSGILKYIRDGKPVREFVSPEAVRQAQQSLTMMGTAVTDGHPGEMVNSSNFSKYLKGAVLATELVEDGNDVRVDGIVTVYDSTLDSEVMSGLKREMSTGRLVDIDPTPGDWKGQRYDVAQTNLRNNHAAFVKAGRAGSEVGANLRIDSADQDYEVLTLDSIIDVKAGGDVKGDNMKTFRTKGGKDIQVTDAEFDALMAEKKRLDSKDVVAFDAGEGRKLELSASEANALEALRKDNKPEPEPNKTDPEPAPEPSKKEPDVNKTDSSNEALLARLDAQDAVIKKQSEDLGKMDSVVENASRQRASLERTVAGILPDARLDSMSNRQLKESVISHVLTNVEVKDKSDIQIDAHYDAAISTFSNSVFQYNRNTNDSEPRVDAETIERDKHTDFTTYRPGQENN